MTKFLRASSFLSSCSSSSYSSASSRSPSSSSSIPLSLFSFIFFFLSVFYISHVNADCVFGFPPGPTNNTLCPQYMSYGCCPNASTYSLISQDMSLLQDWFGTDNCYLDLVNLTCAAYCSPNQTNFAGYNSVSGRFSVNISSSYANALLGACGGRCVPKIAVTYDEAFNYNATAWINEFSSFDSTSGSLGPTVIVTNSSLAFSTSVLPGSGQDVSGCNVTNTSGAALSSGLTSAQETALIIGFIFLAVVMFVTAAVGLYFAVRHRCRGRGIKTQSAKVVQLKDLEVPSVEQKEERKVAEQGLLNASAPTPVSAPEQAETI